MPVPLTLRHLASEIHWSGGRVEVMFVGSSSSWYAILDNNGDDASAAPRAVSWNLPPGRVGSGPSLPLIIDAPYHALHKRQEHTGPAPAQFLTYLLPLPIFAPSRHTSRRAPSTRSRPAPAPNRPLHLTRRRTELVQNRERAVDGLDGGRDCHPATACVSNAHQIRDVVACPPCSSGLRRYG